MDVSATADAAAVNKSIRAQNDLTKKKYERTNNNR